MRRLPREYRTGFNLTEPPGKERHLSAGGTRSPLRPNMAPAPPKIGKLELKQEYWGYIEEAAQRYHISPYLIQAVCAIESRYDPKAKSGKGNAGG